MNKVFWKLVQRTDARARVLADKHYSRKVVGATEFCPPGHNIVLLGINDDALRVSHRPDPKAGLELPRLDGFDCWDNPYFRNESGHRASDMILEAIAITMALWGGDIPLDGFHSFVDPKQVRPMKRRGRVIYGYCFQRAGFELYPEVTKSRGLLRYVLPREKMQAIKPIDPFQEQMRMFA